jgi:hypothetical protein
MIELTDAACMNNSVIKLYIANELSPKLPIGTYALVVEYFDQNYKESWSFSTSCRTFRKSAKVFVQSYLVDSENSILLEVLLDD